MTHEFVDAGGQRGNHRSLGADLAQLVADVEGLAHYRRDWLSVACHEQEARVV